MQIFFVKHQLLRLHSCAGKIISICISHREIVRSEKKSASGNEHAKEACKRKPRTQKAACISRREIVCSEKKCKRSGAYFAYAGTEPMQSPLHKEHKSGLYKPLCFSADSIRRRIFRKLQVFAPCTQAQDFFS